MSALTAVARAWALRAGLSLCAGCAAGRASAAAPSASSASGDESEPRALVDMTLQRADGRAVDLASERGRAVLVVAFLMDDLRSQAMLRDAERVARAHPDDLRVLALSGDRHPSGRHRELLSVYAEVLELRTSIAVLADDAIRDGATALGLIERVPVVYLINRAGVLARRVDGPMTYPQLEALVAPALPPRMGAAAPRPTAPEPGP